MSWITILITFLWRRKAYIAKAHARDRSLHKLSNLSERQGAYFAVGSVHSSKKEIPSPTII